MSKCKLSAQQERKKIKHNMHESWNSERTSVQSHNLLYTKHTLHTSVALSEISDLKVVELIPKYRFEVFHNFDPKVTKSSIFK